MWCNCFFKKQMSQENISNQNRNFLPKRNVVGRSKVDINVLLNKIRLEEKKESIEKSVLIGIIFLIILGVGLILSA